MALVIYLDTKQTEEKEIIKKGWKCLIEELGVNDATRFVVSLERGEGDSIDKIKKFWGNKKIEEIHAEIMLAKKRAKL